MIKSVFLTLVVSTIAGLSFAQTHGAPNEMVDQLTTRASEYSETHPTEKIFLHFDKDFYFKGEDSWYKAYVVGPDLYPTNISGVLYVDWIDPLGNIISHKRLKIENGGAAGDFAVDTTLNAGVYTVRSYTNWMRNNDPKSFFIKTIQVFDPATMSEIQPKNSEQYSIDVQFLPEGGRLIAGIKTQVAFKAIDATGSGVDVSGTIVDEGNKVITRFKSSHNGMGSFPFIGDTKKSFRAILKSGESYPLPVPLESGLTLAASAMDPNKILVRIQKSNTDDDVVYLLGQSHGSVCYAELITMDRSLKEIAIPKSHLPEGIFQLTLFDSKGIPECERMLFIRKNENMVVAINCNNRQYGPRDSITFSINVKDHKQKPVQAQLSLSVTDAEFDNLSLNAESIYTRLLLQSDLKGHVENPGWYFQLQDAGRTYALDLVMLTHGWSGYDWKNILSPKVDASFLPEKGITLSGHIMANKNPVANAPFIFMVPEFDYKKTNIYETDSLGNFEIRDLDISDTAIVSWRVMKKKGSYVNPKIELIETEDLRALKITSKQLTTMTNTFVNKLYEKSLARFQRNGIWTFGGSKMLEEVVVKATRLNVTSRGLNAQVIKPTESDLQAVTSQFVNRYAPGISAARLVRVNEDLEIWTLPSGGAIVISIDGYIRDPEAGMAIHPYLLLNTVPADQVDMLLVAGDPHNGFFIDLRTKDPSKMEAVGTIKLAVKGYDVAREFYHPKYGPTDPTTFGPDNRITLYWNANFQTDKDGTAIVKFYNNDATEQINVVVEGIAGGKTISGRQIIGRGN